MNEKTLRTVMIVALCVGIVLMLTGIIYSREGYSAPLYISQDFTISSSSSMGTYNFTIKGKIKNRTAKEIKISTITVLCSAPTKNNTKYTATWTDSNIVIPANGEIAISGSDLVTDAPTVRYDNVSWVKCSINGTEYFLDYSKDGITFESTTGYLKEAWAGGIICVIAIVTLILNKTLRKH
ncbi:MAG: hypothetical protein NC350_04150 [Corallococcus sp.]|nr:hypothetical protein [Ruminococcus flavefaciens]MCM1043380.1 hypothetical protein [Corallococcus sp.]